MMFFWEISITLEQKTVSLPRPSLTDHNHSHINQLTYMATEMRSHTIDRQMCQITWKNLLFIVNTLVITSVACGR